MMYIYIYVGPGLGIEEEAKCQSPGEMKDVHQKNTRNA